jgi:hypothetical protein
MRNRTHVEYRHYVGVSWLIVVVGLSGCKSESDTGPVAHWKGRVTIGGKPIPPDAQARISFMPEITQPGQKAKPSSAEIVDSKYDAANVPVGPVTVSFNIVRWAGETTTAGGDSSRPVPKWEFLVPENYKDGIPMQVEEGELTKDFDL